MNSPNDDRPHVDAVAGQAAWTLVQFLALRLVKEGVVPKKTLQDDLAVAIQHHKTARDLNPAQRGAAHLLAQCRLLLNTADRSDAH